MSAQFGAACEWAILGAGVTAVATFFTTLQTGWSLEEAAIAAGAAAFTYVLVRGDRIPSDV